MVVMHLKVELIRLSPHKKEGQSLCISSIPAIAKGRMQENDIYKSRNYLATAKNIACFFKNKDTKVHDIPRSKGNLRRENKKVSEIFSKTSEIFSKKSEISSKMSEIILEMSEFYIWQLGEAPKDARRSKGRGRRCKTKRNFPTIVWESSNEKIGNCELNTIINRCNALIAQPAEHFLNRGFLAIHQDADAINFGCYENHTDRSAIKQN